MSQQLSFEVLELYLAVEAQILANISASLVANEGVFTEDDILSWQVKQLAMIGELNKQNLQAIADMSGVALEKVVELLESAGYAAATVQSTALAGAVASGLVLAPSTAQASIALSNILDAFVAQAQDTLNIINTTMLTQSEQIYRDIVTKTTAKVLAGVTTPQQARVEVARQWAEHGVPALVDKAGKKWSTEAYVNTVVRSMSNKVATEMQLKRIEEHGIDLIEVSSHLDARPKCAADQGRIYSLSGKSKKYPAWSSTSFGEPDGLLGINCRHVIYPFIYGRSQRTYFPYDAKVNEQAYEASQVQRKLERDIRKAKREQNTVMALGNKEQIAKAKKKVKQRQENMREFIAKSGRERRRDREQIV
ncbi:phage minor capsid protein [Solibacillus sp. FSL R7-0668]|uniref:phage minor capsid protein n=1 Tax=Solibacillus sp. FSL R7-0668 TaxID=2921688 RepID=UPI0030F4FABE